MYLFMIRSQDNPTTESIAKIDHPSTTAKPQHFRQRCLHSQNEHLQEEWNKEGGRKQKKLERDLEKSIYIYA